MWGGFFASGHPFPHRRPPLALQNPQLRRPVHQCQAQPLDIGIAGAKLGFRGRELPAATRDSRVNLGARGGEFGKGSSVGLECCRLA